MVDTSIVKSNINPFICSTNDFAAERLQLSNNVFPTLRRLCLDRGGYFDPIEWDCNLDQERLERGLALHLALECITKSSPFFMCFIGERYGTYRPEGSAPLPMHLAELDPNADWIDKNMVYASECGYKWLLDDTYTNTSLFELKLIQAAFLSDEAQYCRFYIREQDASMDSKRVPPFEKFKLQQLKASIAKRGLHVTYYSTIEELSNAVLAEWSKIIIASFPSLSSASVGVHLLQDQFQHRMYGEKKSESFVIFNGVNECFRQLQTFSSSANDYCYDPLNRAQQFEKATGVRLLRREREKNQESVNSKQREPSICVLTGPRGCGKTALVSYWLNNRNNLVPDGTKVIHHYVSCDRLARDVIVFMKRCITELRKEYFKNFDERFTLDGDYPDFNQLKEAFLAALGLGPCFIVLDGLDELSDSSNMSLIEVKKLTWLADILPPGCKFLFTVTDSDLAAKHLSQRKDAMFISCPVITTMEDKESILDEYLNHLNVTLGQHHRNRLLSYRLSSSPLYLFMMANEFKDFNVMRDMDSHLHVYANGDSISNSTRDMWQGLIKRWIRDFSWTRYKEDVVSQRTDMLEDIVINGWVPDALRLIACSRNGLYIEEILGTLRYGLGYMGKRTVTAYDWMLFYNSAQSAFYVKPNGLITFSCEHFTEVLDFLLLGNINPPARHELSFNHRNELQKISGMERRQFHISIASHLLSRPADIQLDRSLEILWQLEMANDHMRLCNILLLPQVIERLNGPLHTFYAPTQIELLRFFNILHKRKVDFLYKIEQQMSRLGIIASQNSINEFDEANISGIDQQDLVSASEYGNAYKKIWDNRDQEYQEFKGKLNNVAESLTSDYVTGGVAPSSKLTSDYVQLMPITLEPQLAKISQESAYSHALQTSQSAPTSTIAKHSAIESLHDITKSLPEGIYITNNDQKPEETPQEPEDSVTLLMNQLNSEAQKSTMVYVCCKIMLLLNYSAETLDTLLSNVQRWLVKYYPLAPDELFILSHIYDFQCQLRMEQGDLKKANELLHKSHEALVDMTIELSENDPQERLLTFLRAKRKANMAYICMLDEDMSLVDGYLAESKAGMHGIKCVTGIKYTHYIMALLRYKQKDYVRSTDGLVQCLEYFEQWLGTMHPLVADICHHLGIIFSDEANDTTRELERAENLLWKALNIRRERDPDSLSAADTLFHLAFLVQKQGSKIRKNDAIEFLQSCLDIRTKRLGTDHRDTQKVVFLLNDLEISLQLGQYEFGEARPIDLRTTELPYSQLTMHEKALNELKIRQASGGGTAQTRKKLTSQTRPASAFQIEKTRSESRLAKTLASRPRTAPNRVAVYSHHLRVRSGPSPQTHGDQGNLERWLKENAEEVRSDASSPRTYCSIDSETIDRPSTGKSRRTTTSVLEKYGKRNTLMNQQKTNTSPISNHAASPMQHHKCAPRGPYDIYPEMKSTINGPNSNISSLTGYVRPVINKEPLHSSAWYHMPNNYRKDQPHLNLYSLNRNKLTKQRSKSAPLHSRFLTQNIEAIDYIADPDYEAIP